MVKQLQTNCNYSNLRPTNIKSILKNFDGYNHNYRSMCVFPSKKLFGRFLPRNTKIGSAGVKEQAGPSNQDEGYKTDKITHFGHKHHRANWTWYLCCLSLELQYLRESFEFL